MGLRAQGLFGVSKQLGGSPRWQSMPTLAEPELQNQAGGRSRCIPHIIYRPEAYLEKHPSY